MATNETDTTATETPETTTGGPREHKRATKIGKVVSNSMQKTVVVAVENKVMHPMYQKYVRQTSRFLAHDESNELQVGDRVEIEESRPLSKRKRWQVRQVIQRAS